MRSNGRAFHPIHRNSISFVFIRVHSLVTKQNSLRIMRKLTKYANFVRHALLTVDLRNQLDGELRSLDKETVRNRKMMRIFLIGTLFGVMMTAAVTYVFALPANSNYWRMEIWKRGGAAWTVDKSGHFGWKWMVDPIPDTPIPAKRAVVPPSTVKVNSERL
jgi:hypothetical protein